MSVGEKFPHIWMDEGGLVFPKEVYWKPQPQVLMLTMPKREAIFKAYAERKKMLLELQEGESEEVHG